MWPKEYKEHSQSDLIVDKTMRGDLLKESTFTQFLDAFNEGIVIEDSQGYVTYVNDKWCQILEINRSDVLGKPVYECIHSEEIKVFLKKANNHPSDQSIPYQTCLERKDRSILEISISITALYKNQQKRYGNLISLSEIPSSIIEKKLKEQKREHLSQLLYMEQLASVGMMNYLMSRELNQRISVTKLILQELKNQMQENPVSVENNRQYVDESIDELEQMANIVNTYRHASKYKKLAIKNEILLSEIVGKLRALYYFQNNEKAFEVILDQSLYDAGFVQTQCDLEQVLFILIINAYEAALPGHSNKVEVSCQLKDSTLTLTVSDNCKGIKAKDIPRIFEPHYTTKASDKATGMGLCIVKELLDLYDGNIQVRSQVDQGTTFTILLPIQTNSN